MSARTADRILNTVVRTACILVCIVCFYAVYDAYLLYRNAGDKSILAYKPKKDGTEAEQGYIEGSVAWLTMDGTPIDYPVMQGTDNIEYINKDPYGEYSVSGSIFLDCRNRADFSDGYNLIYGHHMQYNYMFGILDKYMDEQFLKAHNAGTLVTTDGKIYSIRLFAAMEAMADNREVFEPTECGYPLSYIERNAVVTDRPYTDTGKIIALSTCKYPETNDRTIVFGFLTEEKNEK